MDVRQVDPTSPVSPLHHLVGALHADPTQVTNVACFRAMRYHWLFGWERTDNMTIGIAVCNAFGFSAMYVVIFCTFYIFKICRTTPQWVARETAAWSLTARAAA